MTNFYFPCTFIFSSHILAIDLFYGVPLFLLKIFLSVKRKPFLAFAIIIPLQIPLRKLKILSFKNYHSKLAELMWDFDHAGLPSHIHKFFKYSAEIHRYVTRSSKNANLAQYTGWKTKIGSFMLRFIGPKVLNL